MNVPTLDLHGLRHHEVGNEVARFIESWLGNDLLLDDRDWETFLSINF